MTGARVLITGISAAAGTYFAVLAGLSISAMVVPVRRFHAFSPVIAVVTICLAYVAFRAATAGQTHEQVLADAFRRGVIGAFIALVVIAAFILMFGSATHTFLAHAMGKATSQLTTFHLLLSVALVGFGAGFIARIPRMERN